MSNSNEDNKENEARQNQVKEYLKNGKRVAFADAEDPGFWSKLRFGKLKTIILLL